MRSDKEDSNQDPQQTLKPGQTHRTRRLETETGPDQASETRGRRLKLGTPTRNPAPTATQPVQQSEISSAVHRGFTLGPEVRVDLPAAKVSKTGVQPWILVVAGGALLLLLVALLLRPSGASSAEAIANERLLAQYSKYLETKAVASGINVTDRRKDVVARLQAVAWAKAVGDKAALENELTALMFLDNDKASPLYQYSVAQLKQLGPPKKTAGS